jgi:hypothetical protein
MALMIGLPSNTKRPTMKGEATLLCQDRGRPVQLRTCPWRAAGRTAVRAC